MFHFCMILLNLVLCWILVPKDKLQFGRQNIKAMDAALPISIVLVSYLLNWNSDQTWNNSNPDRNPNLIYRISHIPNRFIGYCSPTVFNIWCEIETKIESIPQSTLSKSLQTTSRSRIWIGRVIHKSSGNIWNKVETWIWPNDR